MSVISVIVPVQYGITFQLVGIHNYGNFIQKMLVHGFTCIVNACGYTLIYIKLWTDWPRA